MESSVDGADRERDRQTRQKREGENEEESSRMRHVLERDHKFCTYLHLQVAFAPFGMRGRR